jgi:hypothetical protein
MRGHEPTGHTPIRGRLGRSRRSERRLGRLTASHDIDAAAWILVALRDFDYTVGSIVPPVFDAYARVFHPASRGSGEDEVPVRWADVAAANGRVMHPAAEWGSITGSSGYQYNSTQPSLWDTEPSTGNLPAAIAQRLAAVLSEHTDDPSQGSFGIWEGWGTPISMFFSEGTAERVQQQAQEAFDAEVAAWRGLVESAASFQVPQRPMHLLRGPLVAIEDFYERYDGPSSLCLRNPPSLWWPADGRWCVGTDIDLMTTYVGGSTTAIEALLADDQLEVLSVADSQSVTWEADTINPLPESPN